MEHDRIYRLAKSLAVMEGKDAVIFRNDDGTYGFGLAEKESDIKILEYVTPYL